MMFGADLLGLGYHLDGDDGAAVYDRRNLSNVDH